MPSRSRTRTGPLPVDDLTAAIESDIALTVGALRHANVDLPPRQHAKDIPTAVQSLGRAGLRALLERVSGVGVFQRVPGWEMTLEQFRIHAVATQRAAEQVAGALDRPQSGELLVAALLHDIGKLVLANAHPGYPSAVHGPATTPEDRLVAERRELGVDHAVAGGVMARRWNLPEGVVNAVEHHHDPSAEGDIAIIRLADMLAHHGHGRVGEPARARRAGRQPGTERRRRARAHARPARRRRAAPQHDAVAARPPGDRRPQVASPRASSTRRSPPIWASR